MKTMIAYCGLNCETCDAYLATVHDDPALREKTAREWSRLNGVEITPDQIRCEGCRADGVKTVYCDSLCPIRRCALKRGVLTCGDCSERKTCDQLRAITDHNPQARANLSME